MPLNMPTLDGATILEALPEGAIVIDQDSRIRFINAAAVSILGVEADSAVGRSITDLLVGFELDRLSAEQVGEFDLPSHGVRYRVVPIMTGAEADAWHGRLILLDGITHDIFARRDAAGIVAALFHDLRAPLTTAIGYADLLLLEAMDPLSEMQREGIGVIKANAGRVMQALSNLLTAYRIRSGQLQLDREDLDIVLVVEEVAQTRTDSYAFRDIKLTIDRTRSEIIVSADQQAIRDTLLILLDNACQRSQPGGEVIIAVVNDDDGARVTIQDTDIYCDTERLLADRHKYWHIPMIAAHDLVRLHGGRLWVESVQGQGCKVSFTLPRAAS